MKKITAILVATFIILITLFTVNIYAVELNDINILVDKTKVAPGENVTVEIDFGEDLGSYTTDIAYDNNLFEYVSSIGGTANDNGARIRVYYFDTTGGQNPRSNMSVTFKAKDVTTSNPTNFSITANGLANSDASISYDDITTPIIKNIVVEPEYVDYTINLTYSGDVIKNVVKDINLKISSSMGRTYAHTRIVATLTSPEGANVNLVGTDEQNNEHDIIQNGWGDASGNAIGGKNVSKELALKGTFSDKGNYSITFKLIDRDNSDTEIVSKTFNINVLDEQNTNVDDNTKPNNQDNSKTEEPTEMPKTGNTVYWYMIPIMMILLIFWAYTNKEKKI